MRTGVALKATVQWLVQRLGVPGSSTSLRSVAIPLPGHVIPACEGERSQALIALLRYPVTPNKNHGYRDVWGAYEDTIDAFKGTPPLLIRAVGDRFGDILSLTRHSTRSIFGTVRTPENEQLETFALACAHMVHELYGCPLITEGDTYAAVVGPDLAMGISKGFIVSRFNPGLPANLPRAVASLEWKSPLNYVTSPLILNLLRRAEENGDELAQFAIRSAVWLSPRMGVHLHRAVHACLASYAATGYISKDTAPKSKTSARKVTTTPPRVDRMPLSDNLLRQGLYILDNSDTPAMSLKHLLVPLVLSADDYQRKFCNAYKSEKPGARLLEKMKKSLHELARSREIENQV